MNRIDLLANKNLAKVAYTIFNSLDHAIQNSARAWNAILQAEFDQEIHRKAFKNMYKVTNISKLRAFQYRLLHNKIFCNNVLSRWKIKATQLCDFGCGMKQDICHLLLECPIVQLIWSDLKYFFAGKNIEVVINLSNIVYNTIYPKPGHIANFITLITKQFIYWCKCEDRSPTTGDVLNEIYLNMNVEKYNATIINRTVKHNEKWSIITQTGNTTQCEKVHEANISDFINHYVCHL